MTKFINATSVLCTAIAFIGCSSDEAIQGGADVGDVGKVAFNLDLPNGEAIDEIELHLTCESGIDQTHILDVTGGEVVAAFTLAPGDCTATLHSQTDDGRDCDGEEEFVVIADDKVDVEVGLVCQGDQASTNGQANVEATFEIRECAEDRIKKIYAIPSNLLLGEGTTVEVETENVVGTPTFTFAKRNDVASTGDGDLTAAALCAPASASCQDFTCSSVGASPVIDPDTLLPTGSVYITVTVEDDECFDTEEVLVDCAQSSVCGDGTPEGLEECDDGNTDDLDGCSASCLDEVCGDDVIQPPEECDGATGVGANQSCNVDCELVDVPFCGDGLVNQASEVCDGDAGLANPAVQDCSAGCQIIPDCGNGVVEGTEVCDDGNANEADGCLSDCTTAEIPNTECIDCIDDPARGDSVGGVGGYVAAECSDTDTTGCREVLECYIDNGCYNIGATPAYCFCGGSTSADLSACQSGTVAPFGPCADEIFAAGGTGLTASQVVSFLNGGGTQAFSDAGVIMSFTTQGGQPCFGECQP